MGLLRHQFAERSERRGRNHRHHTDHLWRRKHSFAYRWDRDLALSSDDLEHVAWAKPVLLTEIDDQLSSVQFDDVTDRWKRFTDADEECFTRRPWTLKRIFATMPFAADRSGYDRSLRVDEAHVENPVILGQAIRGKDNALRRFNDSQKIESQGSAEITL